jgi:hypothetical protein
MLALKPAPTPADLRILNHRVADRAEHARVCGVAGTLRRVVATVANGEREAVSLAARDEGGNFDHGSDIRPRGLLGRLEACCRG